MRETGSNVDIHNFKGQYERLVKRILESDMEEGNKATLIKFRDYLISENIGLAKITRYLYDLVKFNKMLGKLFLEATEEDMRRIISEINQQDLSEHTKRGFKLIVKRFYQVLRGIKERGVYPPEVKWISLTMSKRTRKLPEELLNEEEIKEIIRKCETSRDKAFISALAETGARVSEIATMKIKHISFEQYGARLTIDGKTGMRKVLIISCVPYLQQWINLHPLNNDPNAFLWHNSQDEKNLLSYARISAILQKAAKKAGIKKRVHPHLLRHSRATQLASIMSESSMKQYFGWTQGSDMAAIYVHMNGKETDEAILAANGVEVEKQKPKPLIEPKRCIKCNTLNEATNRCCKLCGLILDEEYAQETLKDDVKRTLASEIVDKLLKIPNVVKFIEGYIES